MYICRLSSCLTLECHTAASQENIRRKSLCDNRARIFRAKKTVLRENTTTIVFLFREDLAGIIAAVEGTIGDGFEEVLLLDVCCALQIGYRTRDLQYTVIRTCGEAQLGHCELQQLV